MPRETDQQRKARRVQKEADELSQSQSQSEPPSQSPPTQQQPQSIPQSTQETETPVAPETTPSAQSVESPSSNPQQEEPVSTDTAEPQHRELPDWVKQRRQNVANQSLISEQPQGAIDLNQLSPDAPALQSLVYQLLSNQKTADQKFYLVVVPEDDKPQTEAYDAVELLMARINELLGTRVSIFAFMGFKMAISKGPNRYLKTPFGTLPLFSLPKADEMEYDDDGYVGEDETELTIPTAAAEAVLDDDAVFASLPRQDEQPQIEAHVEDDEYDTPVLPVDSP